jgi:hypothetical protein
VTQLKIRKRGGQLRCTGPEFSSGCKREIPVSVNSLSNSIFSIQPKERLTDGE